MLAAITLLLAQSPADQHRLTWVTGADGSATTRHRIGDDSLEAACRTQGTIRCIVVRRTGGDHIIVRRVELDRLPSFTIGLAGNGPGYGCDWIRATRTVVEAIRDTEGAVVSRQVSLENAGGWSKATVEAKAGHYYPCRAILSDVRRNGLRPIPLDSIR